MSCNSAIYTVNQTGAALAANAQVPFGSAIRRFGKNLRLDGDSITVCGSGYYDLEVSATIEPTAAGPVTIQAYLNGSPIQGAFATETAAAAGDAVNPCISCMFRISCCDSSDVLTLRLGDEGGTIVNVAAVVTKV